MIVRIKTKEEILDLGYTEDKSTGLLWINNHREIDIPNGMQKFLGAAVIVQKDRYSLFYHFYDGFTPWYISENLFIPIKTKLSKILY